MKYAVKNDLHHIQQSFAKTLQYQDSSVSQAINANHFSAEQRLQIYRNNFILSLTEILAAVYPTVKAMIGHDCFVQLARLHILHSPLNEGDVSMYGEGFHVTIAKSPTVNKALPYLVDLAQLEWYRDIVSRMPTQQHQFPLEKLQQLQNSDDLDAFGRHYFHIPDATYVMNSSYNVGALWQLVQNEMLETAQTTASANNDPFAELDINQPQTILIQQRNRYISTQGISAQLGALLIHCQQQKPLNQASDEMLAQLPYLLQYQLVDDILEANDG
ncbi:HvfC/BufC N-terminal domain-containing protein [Photobacterium leiognathi]|uniref:HvfC/BufC N-terminal domain-containing protein n=1 Tax=Photobacterium leiognathi TaxID=553611 RepID=UPI000D175CD8|nr:DNA-binding domain-containing protein [Photobacterium leiognathi]PSU99077.1 DUF2063 domain-containing protein [Photobacterium leiognathi subsp. mandapamensis]